MAWGNSDDSEIEISKFNPAQHKMNRINFLSQLINETKLNLRAKNLLFSDWNYNLYFNALKGLYGEVFIKFTDNERERCEKIRILIEKFLSENPIRIRINNQDFEVDEMKLALFRKIAEFYETTVKDYQDEHGLDTPNEEDDEGL